jgi:hypothetical protein
MQFTSYYIIIFIGARKDYWRDIGGLTALVDEIKSSQDNKIIIALIQACWCYSESGIYICN